MRSFLTLAGLVPVALAQSLDWSVVDALVPTTVSIAPKATGATVPDYIPDAVYAAIQNDIAANGVKPVKRDISAFSFLDKRTFGPNSTCDNCGDCSANPLGNGPVTNNPDTPEAFLANPIYSTAALGAPTPSGYVNTYKNLNASSNANYYMGFSNLDTYDSTLCGSKCSAKTGCMAFNIYFERVPTVDAGPDCMNPPSTTFIRCVLWGGPVNKDNAVNYGQTRGDFKTVKAGSNGYVNQTTSGPGDSPTDGYTDPVFHGNSTINAPKDCNKTVDTYMGYKLFTDVPFDIGLCKSACTAQSLYNLKYPPKTGCPKTCMFFNTYLLIKNGTAVGQYCSMYTRPWGPEYATNTGETRPNGDVMTRGNSYSSQNVTFSGSICNQNCTNPSSSSTLSSSTQTKTTTLSSSTSSKLSTTSSIVSTTSSSSVVSSSSSSSSAVSSSTSSAAPSTSSTSSAAPSTSSSSSVVSSSSSTSSSVVSSSTSSSVVSSSSSSSSSIVSSSSSTPVSPVVPSTTTTSSSVVSSSSSSSPSSSSVVSTSSSTKPTTSVGPTSPTTTPCKTSSTSAPVSSPPTTSKATTTSSSTSSSKTSSTTSQCTCAASSIPKPFPFPNKICGKSGYCGKSKLIFKASGAKSCPSKDICAWNCQQTDGCGSFSWNEDDKACHLFDEDLNLGYNLTWSISSLMSWFEILLSYWNPSPWVSHDVSCYQYDCSKGSCATYPSQPQPPQPSKPWVPKLPLLGGCKADNECGCGRCLNFWGRVQGQCH